MSTVARETIDCICPKKQPLVDDSTAAPAVMPGRAAPRDRPHALCKTPPGSTTSRQGDEHELHQGDRHGLWAAALARPRRAWRSSSTRFGMVRAARTPTALYMRGTDPAHHIHVTEKGEPKFVGFAYYAASEDDLKRIAKAPGASAIENDRRARRRQARAADRAERLPDRGRARHARRCRRSRPAAPAAQLRRRAAAARGRADAAAEGPVAREAHRPRRDRHAEVPTRPSTGSATRSASSARTTSMPARRTT